MRTWILYYFREYTYNLILFIKMKKILVIYYSRTGLTKKLAMCLMDLLHADGEEIIDRKKRSGIMWYIGAGKDAALKRQTNIQEVIHDPSAYDLVCIGTPVWDFTMASAIRTYLTIYEKKLPASLVFFCTQASSWADTTFQEMANITGKKPITTIVCTSKNIAKNQYQAYVKAQLIQSWLWME